jgi:hypothetical protein
LADHISAKDIKQIQNDQVPTPEIKDDEEIKTVITRINVTEKNNASDDKDKSCYSERNLVKKSAKKSVEEHIVPAFCLAEVDFNVENSYGESDLSDYLQPVDKGNHGPDARNKLTSDIIEFCIADVDFDIERKDQCLVSEINNGEGSDEIQNNMFGDLWIADLNFNVPNMEEYLEPSRYMHLQQNVDVESTKDVTPITDSTGLCIAELNFEIEGNDCVSESADYVEPIELRVKEHPVHGEVSETEKYEMLEKNTITKLCIPDSNALDVQS